MRILKVVILTRHGNYLNSCLSSPLTEATNTGTPVQAGTKYSKAGYNINYET